MPEGAARRPRPDRGTQSGAADCKARCGQGDELQGLRRALHRRVQGRLAQREARGAVGRDPQRIRLPIFWRAAGASRRCRARLKGVEPIWTTKPETASRVRGRIESILDWATARGYRAGENPARWRGHLENLLPKKTKVRRVEHHASLPYSEISTFVAELRTQEGIAAHALEFAILTAARTGEVIGARWDEINIAQGLWMVPAERMKAGKEHRVPLSDTALAILERLRETREGNFVFPGSRAGRPISNMAMLMLLRRMGRGDLTAHGFRSSFRDWAAERTTFPAEVAEMALAHTVSDKVEAAYRRGDLFQKRRQLADAWARFCDTAPAAGQVVPIRKPTAAK